MRYVFYLCSTRWLSPWSMSMCILWRCGCCLIMEMCLFVIAECGYGLKTGPCTPRRHTLTRHLVGHGAWDSMNGNGLYGAQGEHGTSMDMISCGWSDMYLWLQFAVSLCLFVCVIVVLWSVNVYLLERVSVSCCPSGRTECLLNVIIIMLYRSSWALLYGAVWPLGNNWTVDVFFKHCIRTMVCLHNCNDIERSWK